MKVYRLTDLLPHLFLLISGLPMAPKGRVKYLLKKPCLRAPSSVLLALCHEEGGPLPGPASAGPYTYRLGLSDAAGLSLPLCEGVPLPMGKVSTHQSWSPNAEPTLVGSHYLTSSGLQHSFQLSTWGNCSVRFPTWAILDASPSTGPPLCLGHSLSSIPVPVENATHPHSSASVLI